MLRARGSYKWTAPGPDGLGAAVAEMDFGAAPPILDALAELSADANFGYLPPSLADELAAACAEFQSPPPSTPGEGQSARRTRWPRSQGRGHRAAAAAAGSGLGGPAGSQSPSERT